MSIRSELVSRIEQRTSASGTAYNANKVDAINWAIGEINTVKWNFLLKTKTGANLSQNQKLIALESDFLMPYKFYTTDANGRYELIEGSFDDIALVSPTTTGAPKYFCVSGMSGDYPSVYIGNPMADKSYSIDYGYYKKLSDLDADDDESDISKVYRDDPIVEGAIYKIWLDLEDPKADSALEKFVWSMLVMESTLPFEGESYAEKIRGMMGGGSSEE